MTNKKHKVLTTAICVTLVVLMAWLAKMTFTTSFLGGRTAEIAKCKQNPRYNPARCRELLSARQAPKKRTSTFEAMGANPAGGLQLGQ